MRTNEWALHTGGERRKTTVEKEEGRKRCFPWSWIRERIARYGGFELKEGKHWRVYRRKEGKSGRRGRGGDEERKKKREKEKGREDGGEEVEDDLTNRRKRSECWFDKITVYTRWGSRGECRKSFTFPLLSSPPLVSSSSSRGVGSVKRRTFDPPSLSHPLSTREGRRQGANKFIIQYWLGDCLRRCRRVIPRGFAKLLNN